MLSYIYNKCAAKLEREVDKEKRRTDENKVFRVTIVNSFFS